MVRARLMSAMAPPLIRLEDTFLPFSLWHARADQYRFSDGMPSVENASHDNSSEFCRNDQAFLDGHCKQFFAPPHQHGGNDVTPSEIHDPTYNEELIFDLIRKGVSDESWLSYSRVVAEHSITPRVATADGAREALLEHLFSGDCVSHKGVECKAIVQGERWPQSVGIRMIDLLAEWTDNRKVSTKELEGVCKALGILPSATQLRRSLLSKLASRRRHLLRALDVASLPLHEALVGCGSSSTLDTIQATCAAHDIATGDDRSDLVDNFVGHITRGECFDGTAPGCGGVKNELPSSVRNAVHMQFNVLLTLHGLLTTKQLRRVLDLHGIENDEGDSKKKLKYRLMLYIRKLQKGKLKDADERLEHAERVQKLQQIQKNWPRLVPPQLKEHLIREFKRSTSSETLASFTCASCARELPVKERQCKSSTEIDIGVLSGPTCHWNDRSMAAPPTPFSTGPLANMLLDVHGVQSVNEDTFVLDICTECLRSLQRKTVPKHALANRLYLGPVPEELSGLTMVEESLIAQARAKAWIVKLQETQGGTASPTAQRGLKGNTIVYPQQPGKLATVLPPPIDEILTYICIIFVGSSEISKEWLRTKAKPLVVRREKVYNALRWLKDHNPLYKDIEIATENVHALPEEDVLPYHVERVFPDEAQEAVVSRYDNEVVPEGSTEFFESVVIADVDVHTPLSELTAAAVRHVKSKGLPFVQVAHGAKPLNEFSNVDLFPMLYPTLFPYGSGGFEDRSRRRLISLKKHVKYLFSLKDRRFQTHNSFLFTVFNLLQRRALLLHASLKVKKSSFSRFAREFSSVSAEGIGSVLDMLESGERVVAKTDEERRALRLMKEVNLVTSKVPGSSASRVAMRNEIRALTMTHGMPSFYVTINPADTHNPVLKFLAGAEIDIDRMLEEDIPNFWEQSLLVSSNPVVGAKFFNVYLKAFLKEVLGYSEKELNLGGGILGTVKAHYGCVEAQGRGSLHCHMLIWIEGALNPNEIRDKVMADKDWGQRLVEYLDDTITNVVPADPIPELVDVFTEKDPCTLRGPSMVEEDIELRLASRLKDVSRLAERVQRHRHTHTCYKYFKAGEARTCRFNLSDENVRPESHADQETGKVALRCLDGLVNNFNITMLEAVRCNMDIQFIGSGESAKAMIYYVTDYITKSQLKSHVAYAALQSAVKKCEEVSEVEVDSTIKSKRLLQKCACALVSHQEMSAQQVASYLMEYEDHFTSHVFGCLYWASFERYVDRECPLPVDSGMRTREQDLVDGEGQGESESEGDDDDDSDAGLGTTSSGTGEDEVAISVNSEGDVMELADQVVDYTLRPGELDGFCLWDFVSKTEKVCRRNVRGYQNRRHKTLESEDEREGVDMAVSSDGEQDEPDEQVYEGDTGGPLMGKYEFAVGHKEYDRKLLRIRKRDVVPVPIGPAIPRRDDRDNYERYCRLMLILFKPWRQAGQLRSDAASWEEAYQDCARTLPIEHMRIVDNMQVLHECRDSRDDHMQTRPRDRMSAGDVVSFGDGERAGNELEDIDMTEVLDHLSEIERMSSKKKGAMDGETNECLGELEKAGWFGTGDKPAGTGSAFSVDASELALPEEDNIEDEWSHFYDERKVAWKSEVKRVEVDEIDVGIDIVSRMEDVGMRGCILNDVGAVEDSTGDVIDAESATAEVVDHWTLNKEQRRAFEIVSRHTAKQGQDQLLMYLGGPGGTGKSRVVNALREFFGLRKEGRRFRLAAYTGVAARNIGGATLHAVLQLNQAGRSSSVKRKTDLAAMWDGVDYLFVDEVSMIGCEMLHSISSALSQAKGKTAAFGGVNIIFAGDFAQLPPIGDARLYKDMDVSKVDSGATNRAQAKILGKLLWLSVNTVVILHETMRQAGPGNAEFVSLLKRLRGGVCTIGDYALLRGRLLQGNNVTIDEGWASAPVIVTNNATRDAINVRAAYAFAEKTGRDLHWYHAVDTHRRSVITDPALIEALEGQNSGQTKHRLRRIPLVMGMPVSINQNFDVSAGVVNGSWGYVRAVRYSSGEGGRRYLKSCVVDIPNCEDVTVPHLPAHHFPILPDVTELKFEHGASGRRCLIKRKQVPIEPGFAITAHKAQGQTMGKVAVDLAGCSGTELPYVMVSRSTSIDGLAVLRDFGIDKITRRHSQDLRQELERLENLRLKTILEYGSGTEAREARRLMNGRGCGEGSGSSKRAMNHGEEPNKRLRVV